MAGIADRDPGIGDHDHRGERTNDRAVRRGRRYGRGHGSRLLGRTTRRRAGHWSTGRHRRRHRHRADSRELPDRERHVRLREVPGHQLLDFPLALAGRRGEELRLLSAVSEQWHRRQIEGAFGSMFRMRGNRRATRAAWMRLYAVCSDSRRISSAEASREARRPTCVKRPPCEQWAVEAAGAVDAQTDARPPLLGRRQTDAGAHSYHSPRLQDQ